MSIDMAGSLFCTFQVYIYLRIYIDFTCTDELTWLACIIDCKLGEFFLTERGSKSGIAWAVVFITSQISDSFLRSIGEGMK